MAVTLALMVPPSPVTKGVRRPRFRVGRCAVLHVAMGAVLAACGSDPRSTTAPPASSAATGGGPVVVLSPAVDDHPPVSATATGATPAAAVAEVGAAVEPLPPSPEAPPIDRYPGTSSDDPALAIDVLTAAGSVSTSIGGPNDGHLEGGVPLPFLAPGLESNPRRPNATAYWGTIEMIRAIVRAAAAVDAELPGSILHVNDLGFREGGSIPHHGSHRAGRDVDILFYVLDMSGEVRRPLGVPIEPDGHGTDFGDLLDPADDVDMRLDVPRTWRLVQALVLDEEALVQRIFLVEHVRAMLLAHAEATHAPQAAIDRFAEVTCQPGVPHDDHLHVRFFCTNEDLAAGCADSTPMYPWRRRQLREAGLEPVMAEPREREPSDTTSAAEAEAAAPPMHDAVRAFLDRRELWSVRPHPGRPYCR